MNDILSNDVSPLDFQRKYNIKDAIFSAWNGVKKSTLSNALKKLLPCKSVAQIKNDYDQDLYLDSIGRNIELAKHIPESVNDLKDWVSEEEYENDAVANSENGNIACIPN